MVGGGGGGGWKGVTRLQTPSIDLRHPSSEDGAGKRCSECAPFIVSSEGVHRAGLA